MNVEILRRILFVLFPQNYTVFLYLYMYNIFCIYTVYSIYTACVCLGRVPKTFPLLWSLNIQHCGSHRCLVHLSLCFCWYSFMTPHTSAFLHLLPVLTTHHNVICRHPSPWRFLSKLICHTHFCPKSSFRYSFPFYGSSILFLHRIHNSAHLPCS